MQVCIFCKKGDHYNASFWFKFIISSRQIFVLMNTCNEHLDLQLEYLILENKASVSTRYSNSREYSNGHCQGAIACRTWNSAVVYRKPEMDKINDGWFSELSAELWPGQCFSLKVEKVLCKDESEFQDILVFESTNNGRALVLDGIIQCTQKDEFAYQEMISFLPLCSHPKPERVLIVGGGDGGVAREVDKHPLVKEIVQVEIDEKVVAVSKKYLPFMAKGFKSPKLTLKICDGFEFMKNHANEFDVIITDSSDPIGPAVNLFTESYFKLLKNALKPKGIICSQGGSMWSELDQLKQTLDNCKKHFKTVHYATSSVPSYPDGQIGYVVAAVDENVDLKNSCYRFTQSQMEELELKYYNDEVHGAAFVLPNFIRRVICK